MPALTGLLTIMEKAARKAGGKLRRDFGEIEHLQVSQKGPADFVSKADERAEDTIFRELEIARPDWGFLLEEGGEIAGADGKPRFIVDPLDGTSNFLHGIPHFAISIAVQDPKPDGSGWGDIFAGLVYNPITDESFWAERGKGAWLGHRRMRVSARRQLNEALVATGTPYKGHGDFEEWGKIFAAIGPQVAGIRRFGAASLDLAWLAAGRYDGFWESGLSAWDTAAGCLLVREAGGFVTDYRGRSPHIADTQVLAANDILHSKLHKLLAGALK
ncbi:inositol monophosphatase [Sphingorhabdus sp. IMCC26285]|uniref:Inositol-1-monophosphatase n=1 Tax=Sphingorhabdus profundilacus TaxID=2509718 RepID=A0A6I4LXG1_9SPHN|nr:inositol monophosphatase family protein [Sphingorhabdus profundilacus]MVZ96766.1 inositol monophosphatase [Sphingorhabdus profundilacus]